MLVVPTLKSKKKIVIKLVERDCRKDVEKAFNCLLEHDREEYSIERLNELKRLMLKEINYVFNEIVMMFIIPNKDDKKSVKRWTSKLDEMRNAVKNFIGEENHKNTSATHELSYTVCRRILLEKMKEDD